MTTPSTHPAEITPRALRLVRLALMLGPVLIGAVFAYLVTQNGPFLEGDPALQGTLRMAFLGAAAAAAVGVGVLRRLWAEAPTYARKASLCIAGWGLAEAAAIAGAVYLLLFGSGLVFVVGLLVVGVGFLLLPLPEAAQR